MTSAPPRWRTPAIVTAAGLLGVLLGRQTAPPSAERATTKPMAGPLRVVEASPRPSSLESDCQAELEAMRVAVDTQSALLLGRPVGFGGVPDAFQPDVFERNVRDAVEHCGIEGQVLQVDCSEYPCAALFDVPQVSQALGACDWWRDLGYGGATFGFGETLLHDGEPVPYSWYGSWADVPYPGGDENLRMRMQARRQELLAQTEERFDARPLTEREQLLEQRTWWAGIRDQPDQSDETRAGAQWQIDNLDRKLDELETP